MHGDAHITYSWGKSADHAGKDLAWVGQQSRNLLGSAAMSRGGMGVQRCTPRSLLPISSLISQQVKYHYPHAILAANTYFRTQSQSTQLSQNFAKVESFSISFCLSFIHLPHSFVHSIKKKIIHS